MKEYEINSPARIPLPGKISSGGFAPGVYYYTLRVGGNVQGGRLLLVR